MGPMKTLLRSFRFAPVAAAALGFAPVGGVTLLLISGFLALAPYPLQAQAQPGGATGSPGTRAWTDSRGETHAVSEKVARLLDDPGVWWGEIRANPLFIPDRILDQIPLDQLPIPKDVVGALQAKMHPPGAPAECSPMREWGQLGPVRSDAKSFVDLLATDRVAMVGRVVGIEHGFFVWTEVVGSMVRVQVDEVFKDDGGEVQPGGEVLYPIFGGSISFQGATACSAAPGRKQFSPTLGQSLFLMGLYTIQESHLIQGAAGYSLTAAGNVEDAGYEMIRMPSNLSLNEIRSAPASTRSIRRFP